MELKLVQALCETVLHLTCAMLPQDFFHFLLGEQSGHAIWLVGSSILRDAHQYATYNSKFGEHLLLESVGATVAWHYRPGLKIEHLYQEIQSMAYQLNSVPDILLIHCGGNDLGNTRLGYISYFLKSCISDIYNLLPGTKIIWSAILPRLHYRNEVNHFKLDKGRKRINSAIAKYCISKGGGYIHYPQIYENEMFFRDLVHLSTLGNSIFVENIMNGIWSFLNNEAFSYPY